MTRAGFLADILAHPDDDVPRLVFADWLDDQGEADRAAFIRAQVELARLDLGDERRPAVEAEALRLLLPRRKGWAGGLRRLVKGWEFARGLVEKVRLPARDFLACADELFAQAPIRSLHLTHYAAHVRALSDCPHLARVRELTLTDDALLVGSPPVWQTRRGQAGPPSAGVNLLRMVMSSPHLTGLRALSAPDHRLGRAGAEMLANHPRLAGLDALDLANNEFSEGAVAALAASSHVGSLRRLRLGACSGWSGYGQEDEVSPAVAEVAPLASQLEELDLGACGVRNQALRLLLTLPRRRPLRVVRLERNPLGWFRTRSEVFVDQPVLQVLDLSSCYVDGPVVRAELARRDLSGLVHLGLRNNPLEVDGVEALAGAAALGRLARLELAGSSGYWGDQHCSGDAGAKALAAGTGLPRLSALDLRRQRLTPQGIRHLTRSRLEGQLTWLDLRGNPLGDEGAKRLLQGSWPALVWLDMRDTGIGSAARDALRERFGAGVRL